MLETATRTNPFPGLRSFEPEEDHLFFGREDRIDELLTRLRRSRFLSVVGTSGSGKSSLIRSGLIPSLYSGLMTKAGSSWRVVLFRPGEDPIGHLADALNQPDVLGTEEERDETSRALLEVTLRRSGMGLVDCIRQARVPQHENILVVVDQFEELFRFKRSLKLRDSRDEAMAFVKLLLSAARQADVPIYIVITMRSDFIGNCTEFEGLTEAINDGQYLVPRMTREERRSAIVGPVAVCDAEIAPRLVLRLLNDVGDDPDQLPILQHALMRTWDEWERHHADGEPIDLRHYEAVGTMTEALSQHAEEAFRELADEKSRSIAERMFKALTDLGSDSRGVRSPRPLEELSALTDATEDEVVEVVEAFRRSGRSFLMPPEGIPLRGSSIVDISHESLMRIWKRLINWVDEEARSAQVFLRISKAAAQFQEGKAGLFRDPELQLALNWREETRPNDIWAQRYDVAFERAMVFLDHSQRQRDLETEEKERQRKRQLQFVRRLAIVLGFAALVTLGFGLYAMTSRIEAIENFEEALRQKEIAEEQRQEAEDQRREAEDQRQRTEQARATADQQRQLAVSERERAEQSSREAIRQRGQAQAAMAKEATAREEAEEQRLLAVEEKVRADEMRVQAETSEAETRRLRILSVARELALKSAGLTQRDELDRAALLAVQAYRLHERNGGDPADPDLFGALRTTLARLAPSEFPILRHHQDAVRSLAASPGSSRVASGSDDGTVRLIDVSSPGSEAVSLGSPGGEVRSVAWLDDGTGVAAASLDGLVRLWTAASGEERSTIEAHMSGATALAASEEWLATAGLDGELRLWRIESPSDVRVVRASGSRVAALAFDGDGRLLAAAAGEGLQSWDPDNVTAGPRSLVDGPTIRSLAMGPGGRIAAGTETGPILLFTRSGGAGSGPVELVGHTAAVTALSFAPGSTRLASASLDGTVRLWDGSRPEQKPIELAGHDGWVWTVAFLSDGESLVSGGADRTVRVWPTRSPPLADAICTHATRNLTDEEWGEFLPADIPWEATCR